LVEANGATIVLHGVDRSGMEFACIQGNGIFDGPYDAQSITRMKAWNINAVRIPLNEDCWLGINGVPANSAGAIYQRAVADFVNLFNAQGIYVILDLHWTAPGNTLAKGQMPMPDRDHAPAFWTGVANAFKSNTGVIFDIFNEPYPENGNWNNENGWNCWKTGTCPGLNYQAAGMQELVTAVRATGANNVVILGGLAWSNSFAQWMQYLPTDPKNQTAGSWHSYNFNYCNNNNCWNQYVLPVAQKYPIIVGEMGENDCAHGYIDQLMTWCDSHEISYLGWTWNTWNCSQGPALITNYDGTPTNFGVGLRTHLQRFK